MLPLLDLEMKSREREIADRAEKQRVLRENGVAFEPIGFFDWVSELFSKPQAPAHVAAPQTAVMVSTPKTEKKRSA